jgi:hypothetical protein
LPVLFLSVAATACGGDGDADNVLVGSPTVPIEAFKVEGTLTLAGTSRWEPIGDPESQYCQGKDAYADISQGTPVVARDGSGNIIGTWPLGFGLQASSDCLFAFAFNNVPRSDAYTVGVEQRGSVQYSFAQMEEKDWKIALVIND